MAIGYACLCVGVPGTALAHVTQRTATPERLREVTAANLRALMAMVAYNREQGIGLFRISSDIVPLATHPTHGFDWAHDFAGELAALGQSIQAAGIRVSMHPGQYTVLNSPREEVAAAAVEDLLYHAAFLDALGVDGTCKIILHIGGAYGDKTAAMEAFARRYEALPEPVRRRLVAENDDRSYTVADALALHRLVGVPVIYDNLHDACNPSPEPCPPAEWIARCATTWGPADGVPKVHYSQSRPGPNPRAHSDSIELEPFLYFYRRLPLPVDVMLEVKDKNLSAVRCLRAVGEMNDRPA